MGLELVDDAPKAILAAFLVALAGIGAWLLVDRRSATAARLRATWSRPRGVAVLLIVLGAGVFSMIAEDVLSREPGELMLQLDQRARAGAQVLAGEPALRAAAAVVSRLTGEGLILVVVMASVGLWIAGRRREAAILLGGTLGAWILTAALKLAFAVPRPAAGNAAHAITRYGFPSGHAVVVTVACGLLAWLIGRPTTAGPRLLLGVGVAGIAVLTAAARVVLNAHWLSDVAAGLAIGMTWLGLVILAAARVDSRPA